MLAPGPIYIYICLGTLSRSCSLHWSGTASCSSSSKLLRALERNGVRSIVTALNAALVLRLCWIRRFGRMGVLWSSIFVIGYISQAKSVWGEIFETNFVISSFEGSFWDYLHQKIVGMDCIVLNFNLLFSDICVFSPHNRYFLSHIESSLRWSKWPASCCTMVLNTLYSATGSKAIMERSVARWVTRLFLMYAEWPLASGVRNSPHQKKFFFAFCFSNPFFSLSSFSFPQERKISQRMNHKINK